MPSLIPVGNARGQTMPVGKVRLLGDAPRQRRDPVEHWLEQEGSLALPDDLAADGRPSHLPSGWWILPVILLSLPLWGVLVWAAFRA